MKKIFFILVAISIISLIVVQTTVNAQQSNTPAPIQLGSPLINPNDVKTTQTVHPQINNTCNKGNCPPMPQTPEQPNVNQQRPVQNMPPMQNNIPPQVAGAQMNAPYASAGPDNVLIILDASYSMEDRIGHDRKIDIAKRVVHNTVQHIPPSTRVGLRVYGHKIGLMGIYPCRKTELLVPIDFNTSNQIIGKLRNINPTGQTPISYSIKTAVFNDFNGLNGPKRIILVSDGMETCDGNPCDYAVEMVRRGIDLKIDVVGFALKDPAAINQLKCVALSTGGKFYTADTEAALARSLQNSFAVKTQVQGKIILNK